MHILILAESSDNGVLDISINCKTMEDAGIVLSFSCRKASQHYLLTSFTLVSSTGSLAFLLGWLSGAHDEFKVDIMRKSESTPKYFSSHFRVASPLFFQSMPSSVLSRVMENLCFPFLNYTRVPVHSFTHSIIFHHLDSSAFMPSWASAPSSAPEFHPIHPPTLFFLLPGGEIAQPGYMERS